MENVTQWCIILNITVNLIALSIFGAAPKNRLEKFANIPLKIFDDVYPKY